MLKEALTLFIPSIAKWSCNKKVRKKIEIEQGLSCPSAFEDIKKIDPNVLKNVNEKEIEIKGKLEDKAKTNVIGLTISVTLILGAFSLLQNIYGKLGSGFLYWIAFSLFVLSVIYMLSAGLNVIHVLIAENTIHVPALAKDGEEHKKDLDKQIGLNRARNTIRNNYVFTSYACIRNSLICLLLVMIIAIIPIQTKKTNNLASSTYNNFYYSEAAMDSINNGVDRLKVELFISSQPSQEGTHSVVDSANKLYLKYFESNDTVNVIIIETYE
ncbi:hypothetical protein [Ruminococcus sp.]|uniref:hypothetical protein n=1 Tax=Ruminococcus sp. TaxID=41978 RepID=UPI0025F07AB6|nr:hypothetical protein [Ruminococcus sp.]